MSVAKKSGKLVIGQTAFRFVCVIAPEEDVDGTIRQFMPQERYENDKRLSLNRYGKGPYCKFKIPGEWKQSGVYAIVVDGAVKYIGECVNLASRYNAGYGNISPRNCFVGGQETNCRINHLVLSEGLRLKTVSLWFYATNKYKDIEERLRAATELEWNRI